MWTYHPDLLQRQVPRYTSYPTAVEFGDGVGAEALDDALAELDAHTPISLYAHIPYCKTICHYCGCNTAAANKTQRLTSYLNALESEMMLVGRKLSGRGRVKHIAFGGGSPNAVSALEFVRLMDRMQTAFIMDDPSISIELDPRIFTPEWAGVLQICGVDRVSLGVQSFSERIQHAIGRIQPFSQVADCVDRLRQHHIDAINFDLIYGLPTQTMDDLEDTLRQTLELKPSRIALFGYAHLPSAIPRQRVIDGSTLPDAPTRFAMAERGYQMLVEAGYRAIGFDHFAHPDDALAKAAANGTMRRNFQGFTEDASPVLIGMGASAISCFPDLIVQNEKNMGRYGMMLSQGMLSANRGVLRSAEDKVRAGLIEQLLCYGKSGPIPAAMRAEAKAGLAPYIERGLARWDGCSIVMEENAQPYARVIASIFDQYRQDSRAAFSTAI